MHEIWLPVQAWLIGSGLQLAKALLILLVGWLVARWLTRLARRLFERAHVEATWSIFLSRAVRIALLLIVLLAVLSAVGVETTSVIALIGAAGLTIALAWQGTLSHLASGLLIIGLQLFRVGDLIEVLGVKGTVKDVQLFHTVITDENQVRIILPNAKVTDNVIRNYSGTVPTPPAPPAPSAEPRP